jgi:predicted  nucleic acid-binding Zn-ribbon protein
MPDVSQELMFELLKKIQADTHGLKQGQSEIKTEISALRGTMVSMQQDLHNIYGVLSRHEDRLDRIENRLELRELAEAQARFQSHP